MTTDDLETVSLEDAFKNPSFANAHIAIDDAQDRSNTSGAPVGIWMRDGWYKVCEIPPEDIEPSPESEGWTLHAVVDPQNGAFDFAAHQAEDPDCTCNDCIAALERSQES